MSTNYPMGALIELDRDDPVDQAILNLVKLGLIECCYHDDTGELGVTLTDLAHKYLKEEAEIDAEVASPGFQTFLKKSEKILDKIARGC
jgi:hypothetical protein